MAGDFNPDSMHDVSAEIKSKEFKALRYLIFSIWENEYGRFPLIYGKDYGESYSKEVAGLRQMLIANYGMKDRQSAGIEIKDPDKNFRDIISDIIKGRNSSFPTTDKIDALAHCYYRNTDFYDDPHGDWEKFLRNFDQPGTNISGDQALYDTGLEAEMQEHAGIHKFMGFNICSPLSFMMLITGLCLTIIIAGIISAPLIDFSPLQMEASGASVIISALQILIIAAFIIIYFREYNPERRKNVSLINQTILQFESAWIAILTSLVFLYLWFTLESWLLPVNASLYLSVGDILTSISSFLFYYAYCILETKSLNTVANPKLNRYFKINIFISALICVMLCILSVVNRFGQIPPAYIFVVKLLFAIYPAVTISLFIERLSSRTLIKSRTIIPLLYAYCALQLGYIFKDNNPGINTDFVWILIAALVLKFFLFLEVNTVIDHNRIEDYLKQVLFRKRNIQPARH